MCQNCKRTQVGQISASRGWCASCMNAYKAGVEDGKKIGYEEASYNQAVYYAGEGF